MNAVQFILSEIAKRQLPLTGKQRERLLRDYRRDKLDCGPRAARQSLRSYLDTCAEMAKVR